MVDATYRVLLDKEWELVDLYQFPHSYAQNYAFIYCLDTDLSPTDRARINRALEEYPWKGGFSYVNIYTVLQNQIPPRDRPKIKSISKTSPGWLDLILNVDVAIQVAKSVAALSGAAASAALAYRSIHKTLTSIDIDRRKNELQKAQIDQEQTKLIFSMCAEMAKFLGFKNLKELHQQTKNPEVTLKLLLAHYRRVSDLVKFADEGKAALPTHEQTDS